MSGAIILKAYGMLTSLRAITLEVVDDIWQKPNGDLIVVDVKSTSKNVFDWEDTYSKWEYAKGYRRQLEMYQWLLEKNGFSVASEGYLVYYNGKKNEPMFDQKLEFDLHLVKLECDKSWVAEAVIAAKNLRGHNAKGCFKL